MANKIVGITIDIEGKSDGLVSSLKTANSELSKTTSALKDVNKALELDPSNVELMAQKQALLTNAISETEDKLKVMRQVAEDAARGLEEGTVTQEQYATLTAEIVKTESSLANLTQQAEDNASAMEDVENGTMDAAEGIEDIGEESDESSSKMDAMKGVAIAVGAEMAAAFSACVAAIKEVGGALVDSTVAAGDYVDEINTLSAKTGISNETLQEMNYALGGLIDVSLETVTGSLTKLEKSMNSANEANTKYYETLDTLDQKLKDGKISQEEYDAAVEDALQKSMTGYDKLGISVTDSTGKLRDSEEVFWEAIDALGQLEDGTERDLLAMELFGKSAKELNPLIEAGSDAYKVLAEEAHNVGYVMDGETMDAFQAFDDQMERFRLGGEAAKNALGTVLLPSLNSLATTGTGALNKFTQAMQESNGDITKLSPAISEILTDVLGEINTVAPEIFTLIGDIVNTLLQILIDNLPQIVDTALSIVQSLADTLINPENIAKIADAATTIILGLVQYLVENLPQIIDAAVQIILALVNGLTQSLPQLIPAIINAVLTIVDTLLAGDQLSMILNAGLQLIIALAGALVDALPEIIDRLPEIITGIVEFLTGDALPDIIDAGIQLITAIVTDLPTIIGAIVEALVELVAGMVEYITGGGAEELMTGFLEAFWAIIDAASDWGADIIDALISGITGAASALWDELTDIADGIKDFLGFSVPEKGPLHEWAYNNPGADMVDLFAEGIDKEMPALQSSVDLMANTMTGANAAPDYTNQLNGINGTLSQMAEGQQIVVPVYIGQEHLETLIARANANISFISGGR